MNQQIVEKLIKYLEEYKKEEYFEKYIESILLKDIIYGLGTAIDNEKYGGAPGFRKFFQEKIEELSCMSDARIRSTIQNKDW